MNGRHISLEPEIMKGQLPTREGSIELHRAVIDAAEQIGERLGYFRIQNQGHRQGLSDALEALFQAHRELNSDETRPVNQRGYRERPGDLRTLCHEAVGAGQAVWLLLPHCSADGSAVTGDITHSCSLMLALLKEKCEQIAALK